MTEITEKEKRTIKEISLTYTELLKKCVSNYPFGEEFIFSARIDLKCAKYLIDKKDKECNPIIVYLIQQSVEKYAKAYSLFFGAVSKRAMKDDVGHKSGLALVKALRNNNIGAIFNRLRKVSHLLFEPDDLTKTIVSINFQEEANKIEKIINEEDTNKIKIKDLLDNFAKVRLALARGLASNKFNAQFYNRFSFLIKPFMKWYMPTKNLEEQKKFFAMQFDLICFLYPMLFITPEHEQCTRYPKLKHSKYSPRDYIEKELDIVKGIPRIIDSLEHIDLNIQGLTNSLKEIYELPNGKREKLYKIFSGVEQNKFALFI